MGLKIEVSPAEDEWGNYLTLSADFSATDADSDGWVDEKESGLEAGDFKSFDTDKDGKIALWEQLTAANRQNQQDVFSSKIVDDAKAAYRIASKHKTENVDALTIVIWGVYQMHLGLNQKQIDGFINIIRANKEVSSDDWTDMESEIDTAVTAFHDAGFSREQAAKIVTMIAEKTGTERPDIYKGLEEILAHAVLNQDSAQKQGDQAVKLIEWALGDKKLKAHAKIVCPTLVRAVSNGLSDKQIKPLFKKTASVKHGEIGYQFLAASLHQMTPENFDAAEKGFFLLLSSLSEGHLELLVEVVQEGHLDLTAIDKENLEAQIKRAIQKFSREKSGLQEN